MSTPVAIEEVPGLFVQTEFFSPDIERSLYHDRTLFPVSASALSQDGHRQGGHIFAAFASPDRIPDNLIKVCNGITESGLFEDLIAPDYVFPLNYVDKANFSAHFDSKYRWGETVVAITLGCTGAMSFSPHSVDAKHTQPKLGKRVLNDHGLAVEVRKTAAGFVVDLILPPRSVYVMSGPTRTEWKHAVKTNVAAVRDAHRHLNSPCFRDCSIRRTITLRSCKSTSDEVLNRLARAKPHDQRIQKRVSDQNKWRPQRNGDKLNNHELQLERLAASRIVNTIHTTFRPLFLSDTERGYKVKNPKMTCWPLLDVANALQPSKLVPAEMMTMACGTLGGSVGGRSANASASSSVAVGSGGAQGEWECSLCTLKNRRSDAQCVACGNRRPESERPPDAVRREALIPGGFGFSAPSEEDQLQWALRVSADQARNGPAANEEKMLQRALKASVEEAAKKHSPKVKVEAVKASVEETTTKAPPDTKTEDSPPKLTKEDLRRLRLAALERKTAPPPCDPEGQDNAKRQKRDSTDSQEVIELTNSDDEDVGTQKPSAKKVAEVIELD